MSWQVYVDKNLCGTGNVKFGAICALDGSIWAKSTDWNITQAEVAKISNSFGDAGNLAMSGIMLGSEKFFYISGDSTTVRGKKGNNGVHIAKTKTALIIANYHEPTQPNQAASVVEVLADYLREQNY